MTRGGVLARASGACPPASARAAALAAVLLWSLPAALAPGVAGAVPGAAATPTTAAPQLANAVLPTVFPGYTVLASGPLTVLRPAW